LTHPVRLSALAALDIQQAREWHDAQEPGLGDQFLQRVNETMTRIGQNPHQYPMIIEDVRRANLRLRISDATLFDMSRLQGK
jgi:hypothetical protein